MKTIRIRSSLLLMLFGACLTLYSCKKATQNKSVVYRILPKSRVVRAKSNSKSLASYRIEQGKGLVFSYNRVSLANRNSEKNPKSSSIVFQAAPDAHSFNYTGNELDSARAYFMIDDAGFKQYPISSGYIRGRRINENKWRVEIDISIGTDSGLVKQKIDHVFSVFPALKGEEGK